MHLLEKNEVGSELFQARFRQKVALLDLLPQPRARRYSDMASIDGASYLILPPMKIPCSWATGMFPELAPPVYTEGFHYIEGDTHQISNEKQR